MMVVRVVGVTRTTKTTTTTTVIIIIIIQIAISTLTHICIHSVCPGVEHIWHMAQPTRPMDRNTTTQTVSMSSLSLPFSLHCFPISQAFRCYEQGNYN